MMKVLNSLRTAKERHPDCQIVKRKVRVVRKNVDLKFDELTIFV